VREDSPSYAQEVHADGITTKQELRFWSKVALADPMDCWLWTGYRNPQGYGRVRLNYRTVLAPRVAYALVYGSVPEGMTVDHLCFNPPCVSPLHLQLLTLEENSGRRRVPTHCPQGHPYDEENTYIDPNANTRSCRVCRRAQWRSWYWRNKEAK
jgi:hypothetical protein